MPILSDVTQIEVAKRLFKEGYIGSDELSKLIIDGDKIVDDANFPVDMCENGDVFIHRCGTYPIILRGYFKP